MITKQLVHAEIERLPDEDLDAVYFFILQVKRTKGKLQSSFLQKLKQVQISAPADFSANHDAYANGAERADTDLH